MFGISRLKSIVNSDVLVKYYLHLVIPLTDCGESNCGISNTASNHYEKETKENYD
jgi:hypothetical protein